MSTAWLLAIWFGCAVDTPSPDDSEDTPGEPEPCPWEEDAASAKSSDEDGDGYLPSDCDCDDANSDINPTSREVCNLVDDDCDGIVDEGVATTEYLDGDTDGYGDPDTPTLTCDLSAGYVWTAGDCNDADPTISPDVTERCDNVDNNCDGVIDEGGA